MYTDGMLIKMKAKAWTDGNSDDIVTRIFNAMLEPDRIVDAESEEEAIAYFCTGAR